MADDTKTPPNELPPIDQPWGEEASGETIQRFLHNSAKIIYDYYNYLCEMGFDKSEALALTQVFEAQYWALWLSIIYHGKSKTSD